jgi:lipid II:glycine glycyltransferase (peptidoglycan interpeptide bridge formation enzyme)
LREIYFLSPQNKRTRQPQATTVLDLTKSEDDLLGSMHKNHRYSIRKAEETGIGVRSSNDWRDSYKVMGETAKRHKLRSWPSSYHQKMWESLAPVGILEILNAYKDNNLVATHQYILFGHRVVHLFGGATDEGRELGAPYALHWHAIKEFKNRGYKDYDFWGVDEKRWPELTRFKERFGGNRVNYPGSHIHVLRPAWYILYQLAKKN